jgi:hypothetical protein
MSALVSFLGGSAFRMVWGEVSHFLTARQEHKHELERNDQQARLDSAAHARNLEAMRVQSDLGIKSIEAASFAHSSAADDDAFLAAVRATATPSGIRWVDAWNQSIRPGVATVAVAAMLVEIALVGALTDWHREVFSAALGLYLADRALAKRGK